MTTIKTKPMPFVQCLVCSEMIAAALMQHRVPVCSDCALDVGATARVQARIVFMYEQITEAMSALTDEDADRYHQVWLAQCELSRPMSTRATPAEIQQAVQRRDKLNRQLLNTRKKGDAVSDIMRMRDDLNTQLSLLHTLELAQLALEAGE